MRKNLLKFILLLIISISAVFVWYSPILFKGYSYASIGPNQVLAKNLALTRKYSSENVKNVILASDKIVADGVVSSAAEKLIPVLSAAIYNATGGVPFENKAIIIALIISALAMFIFSILIWRLFDFKTALLFSVLYIFLPVNWNTSLQPNFYEYCLFFSALGFLFFFWPAKKYKSGKYIISGILFALSFYSRNAIGLLFPAILIWQYFYSRKAIIPFFSSLLISVGIISLVFSSVYGSSNNYHLSFFGTNDKKTVGSDFHFYGHLYPDPYTYLYERENYLKMMKSEYTGNSLKAQDIQKRIVNVEKSDTPLWYNIKLAPVLIAKHISNFFSMYYLGGPFIFLLMIFGLIHLFEKKNPIAPFTLFWIGSVLFILSFIVLAQRNHLMEFAFLLVLLLALGIRRSAGIIRDNLPIRGKRLKINFIIFFLAAITIYQLVLGDKITIGSAYEGSNKLKLIAYKEKIEENGLTKDDVIASPIDNSSLYTMNYFTDKSIVAFAPETIDKLLKEKRLEAIFNDFGVTKIMAYTPEMTDAIVKQTKIKSIADDTLNAGKPEISPAKILFLNLVK